PDYRKLTGFSQALNRQEMMFYFIICTVDNLINAIRQNCVDFYKKPGETMKPGAIRYPKPLII
ncbi:MAG: hypothetical protein WCD55_12570, partial [Bacteroidales bacterium]